MDLNLTRTSDTFEFGNLHARKTPLGARPAWPSPCAASVDGVTSPAGQFVTPDNSPGLEPCREHWRQVSLVVMISFVIDDLSHLLFGNALIFVANRYK